MAWVDRHSDSRWIYRGIGDISFELVAGVGRVKDYSMTQERTILEIFERRANEYINTQGLTDWDRLALAQHHGLPTRLLDWTTNPLIGAFFAAAAQPRFIEVDPPAATAPTTTKWRVRPEAAHVNARVIAWRVSARAVVDPRVDRDPFGLSEVKFLMPRVLTARVVTQGGLFSIHPSPEIAWPDPIASGDDLFDIPGNMRSFFLRKLFYLGVDAQRVMGGLDGLCARITWQYDTRIGLGAVR